MYRLSLGSVPFWGASGYLRESFQPLYCICLMVLPCLLVLFRCSFWALIRWRYTRLSSPASVLGRVVFMFGFPVCAFTLHSSIVLWKKICVVFASFLFHFTLCSWSRVSRYSVRRMMSAMFLPALSSICCLLGREYGRLSRPCGFLRVHVNSVIVLVFQWWLKFVASRFCALHPSILQ